MDALLRRRAMISAGVGPTPPTPVPIPYIRGGGNGSYIDTGITADNTVRVIVWARNWNPGSGFLFGSSDGTTQNTYAIGTHGAQDTGRIRIDYAQSVSTYADNQFANLSHYRKYELYNGVLKVDDVVVASATAANFGNSYNIYLFGMNTAGTLSVLGLPVDICACKIYKNDVIVRDYTAVNTPSVGLYDAVSDMVFTNAGSGSFTYGTFNQNAYTPLEYIECDGTQYFDSIVYGSYADGIVAKFMPTNTTPQWTGVLGVWGNDSSCAISLGTSTSGQANMRCYLRIGPDNNSGQAFSGSTSNKLTDKAVVAVKANATLTMYYNNSQIGTYTRPGVSSSFVTNETMRVGMNNPADAMFIGRFYYVRFGTSRNYVPAKVNGVAVMYDTYNDAFYPSITSTSFIAGRTI